MFAAVCGTDPFHEPHRLGSSALPALTAYLGAAPRAAVEGWVGAGAVPAWAATTDDDDDDADAGGWGREWEREEGRRWEVYGTRDAMEEKLLVRLRLLARLSEEEWEETDGGEAVDWFGASAWADGLECERYMSRADIGLFADLLGGMFKLTPGDRASMEEVLNHPWIRDAEHEEDW
ncbi:hypothetical protein B0I37DRAFT_437928 [Chaetomium sp. MPI-CAGE-AT-0009]|nr:hypothetical protein B0I37DRAFT_437928 [Chaetomium sp. MPI-CAGE-AT-0009]